MPSREHTGKGSKTKDVRKGRAKRASKRPTRKRVAKKL